ncbi:villin-3-like isoform X1 [Triticum dicoccoides]|uniref:villin-3-like isoform X1 n=2 Tax=Triticum dicoccoides TaxID=85692 RepID=UPI00188E96DA|nr:villin-3-like isoform X1 [Triticum dicoccoides]
MAAAAPGPASKHTFSSLLKQKSAKTSPPRSRGTMAISMRDVDPAFQGAGQKDGLEIWRIEKLQAVPVPRESHGKFFAGDSYIILKTTARKNGSFQHDIHYWLGKDTSQDESGTAAIKTVELDVALGGRGVQYREVQGNETEKFLSYFKPCIIPEEGGIASGFRHTEINEREHVTRLFVCRGKHTVHVKEVPFARSSLNHDDIFILDTKSKIFQFNGSNSSIQERAKALEVVQYLKDTNHEGKCDVAAVEDGKLMADADAGEFWGLFGGFAPLPRKTFSEPNGKDTAFPPKLLWVNKGQTVSVDCEILTKALLDSTKCYLLDCGSEIYVWMGRETALEDRKQAGLAAEELLREGDRPKSHIIRLMEGFETVIFRSKFNKWPKKAEAVVSDESRGKVAALLKRQGFNVKAVAKSAPVKEEPLPQIDCTGNLQVWRVNDSEKTFLSFSEQCKFYSGDCYIFQYSYPGDDGEECLVGTWFGKKSIEEERAAATSLANKMVESLKFQAVLVRLYEGKEPIEFFPIFQNLVIFKGGASTGYKKFVSENGIQDDSYSENGVALFRVQGSGPDNMQAIQVDAVAPSLNSSYCYILHDGDTVFTWIGNLSSSMDQELAERQLDVIKPNLQSRMLKEGSEYDQFWKILGIKSEYSSQKIARDPESDAHLFCCTFLKGVLKVREIFNFTQDDMMTEDIFILDCHSCVFIWVGQNVDTKIRAQALSIGEKFLELDIPMENLSRETPLYVINEGSEPQFFTRFFTWDSAKTAMHGNSFERRLSILKDGIKPRRDKPKRRTTTSSHTGRSSVPDKSQRRSTSFSPDRVRVRGRSPAFNALAATFENSNARNLSTPPPVARKSFSKSSSPDPVKPPQRAASIAAMSASFERPRQTLIPKSIKASPEVKKPQSEASKPKPEEDAKESTPATKDGQTVTPTIQEDVKEDQPEDEEGLPTYPYDRLRTSSSNPVTDIDSTRRETYLSSAEFREKFGMTKEAFAKLPKWKQNRLKIALQLF